MIYKKDANFPYPILSNTSNAYKTNEFSHDIRINEYDDNYAIEYSCEISSSYIKNLIRNKEAKLLLIINDGTSNFFEVENYDGEVIISKNKLSLKKNTTTQIFVVADCDIRFGTNYDLNEFYNEYKYEIKVPKNSLLAYSDTVEFNGSIKKPLLLFEKRVDENLKSEIKVELREELKVIVFRDPEFQLNKYNISFVYPYIYLGFSRALSKFIDSYKDEYEEYVDISSITNPITELDFKLLSLMRGKDIDIISKDNIDEVIDKISDKLIDKYVKGVESLNKNGSQIIR